MPRAATTRNGAHPIDVHVGARIKMRRRLLGMNQQTLADGLGLTFQQMQKYEKATNRVTAGKLKNIADILGVPVEWFFEGMNGDILPPDKSIAAYNELTELMQNREAVDLVRYYYEAPEDVRPQFMKLLKSIATSWMGAAPVDEPAAS